MRRRHWRCPGCHWSGYLADEWLGLDGYLSGRLLRLACLSASTHSFAVSARHLQEYCGVAVAAETLRQHCTRAGRAMEQWLDQHPVVAETFAEAAGLAEFQMDAGKVNTTEGWRDFKVASFTRRPPAEAATPDQWAERTLPPATAQVMLSAVATIEEFKPRLEQTVERLGLDQADVHCLADGAEWIWKAVGELLHQPRETLDVYHGLEHLAGHCQQIYGEGTELARTRYERAQALLLHAGAAGVATFVAEEAAVRPDTAAALAGLEQYFAKHAARLDYRQNLAEGLPIGSGQIEGNVKTIGLRVKARGARWRAGNVGAIAHLCCLSHGSYWEDYWASSKA